MSSLAGWNAENVSPADDFDQLPAGDYTAVIIDGAWEDVSNAEDKGKCIKFTWQVKDGPHDGRLFWQRLLLGFRGPEKTPGKIVEIAQRSLSAISHATGKLHVQTENGQEMFHIPCRVRIGAQKNNPQYNEVKSVKPVNGAQPAPAQQANGYAQTTQQAAPAPAPANQGGGNVPAFMRRAS